MIHNPVQISYYLTDHLIVTNLKISLPLHYWFRPYEYELVNNDCLHSSSGTSGQLNATMTQHANMQSHNFMMIRLTSIVSKQAYTLS